ncbi:unnamed protein product [Polarella glacialis]|uniref:R3H domain-containing protein n=1 Tax=Polarella glacialis TaxID=89957 RepID=A0A813EWR2_POLGL|nr:unnamed protein product [Polarella glacialis]
MALARVGGSFGLFSASLLHLLEVAIRVQPHSNPVRCDCGGPAVDTVVGPNLSQVLAEAAQVERKVREEEKIAWFEEWERVTLEVANKTSSGCQFQAEQGQLGHLWAGVLSALASLGAVAALNLPLRLWTATPLEPSSVAFKKVQHRRPTKKVAVTAVSADGSTTASTLKWSVPGHALVTFKDDPVLRHHRLVVRICNPELDGCEVVVVTPDRDVQPTTLEVGQVFSEVLKWNGRKLPAGIRSGDCYLDRHSDAGAFTDEDVRRFRGVAARVAGPGEVQHRLKGRATEAAIRALIQMAVGNNSGAAQSSGVVASEGTARAASPALVSQTAAAGGGVVTGAGPPGKTNIWPKAKAGKRGSALSGKAPPGPELPGDLVKPPASSPAFVRGGSTLKMYVNATLNLVVAEQVHSAFLTQRCETLVKGSMSLLRQSKEDRDVRVLEVMFDSGEERWRTLGEAVPNLIDVLMRTSRCLGQGLFYTMSGNFADKVWTLSLTMRALNRRRAVIEFAHVGRPDAPVYEAAEEMQGLRESADGTMVDPALTRHVAQKQSAKAEVLKQQRLVKEEKNASFRQRGTEGEEGCDVGIDNTSRHRKANFGDLLPLPFPSAVYEHAEAASLRSRRSKQRTKRRSVLFSRECETVRALNEMAGFEDASVWPAIPMNGAQRKALHRIRDAYSERPSPSEIISPQAALRQLLAKAAGIYAGGPGILAPYVREKVSLPHGQQEATQLAEMLDGDERRAVENFEEMLLSEEEIAGVLEDTREAGLVEDRRAPPLLRCKVCASTG